jgi:hypothetical protein
MASKLNVNVTSKVAWWVEPLLALVARTYLAFDALPSDRAMKIIMKIAMFGVKVKVK